MKLERFLVLVDELKARGATRVRAGEFECDLAPERPAAPVRKVETAKERTKREDAELEADLLWSVGGPERPS